MLPDARPLRICLFLEAQRTVRVFDMQSRRLCLLESNAVGNALLEYPTAFRRMLAWRGPDDAVCGGAEAGFNGAVDAGGVTWATAR